MKTKLVALVLGVLFTIPCVSYADNYYWYKGDKITLEQGSQQYLIFQDDLIKESDKAQIIYCEDVSIPGFSNLKWGVTKSDALIEDAEHVLYQTPSFRMSSDNHYIFVTHRFYVKLKSSEDMTVLQDFATQYHVEIEGKGALSLWYIMRWSVDATYNALELANIFYESGLFASAEPEFINSIELLQANQQIFDNQSQKPAKLIRGGQVLVKKGDKTYTLQGTEIK